jgi:hypothetical protein
MTGRLARVLLLAGLVFGGGSIARAAQIARIDVDEAVLLESPRAESQALVKLRKGEYIVVSNYPYEGYYKARSQSGEVGFVSTQNVFIIRDPEFLKKHLKQSPETRSLERDHTLVEDPRTGEIRTVVPVGHNDWKVALLGGMTLFPASAINTAGGTAGFIYGFHFGLELGVPLNERFAVLLRAESLSKSLRILRSSDGVHTHTYKGSSFPVAAGIEWRVLHESGKFWVNLSALAGAGFSTSFSSYQVDVAKTALWEGTALTWMAKGDIGFRFADRWLVFFEAGYRSLATAAITGTGDTTANGDFQDTTVNPAVWKTFAVDYSGFFVSLGGAFYF